jgi:hypothetical protein
MDKNEKKKWVKPEVKRVILDGRTSVLGSCKARHQRGPLLPHCNAPGGGTCKTLGS